MTGPRFLGSFPRADAPLDPPLPEIALVGRSNVGKSSLLNALAGRRLARLSTTPGTTQAMNVYELPLPAPRSVYLLDLPGYGYARAGRAARAAFRRLVTHALARPGLRGIVWLLDTRREPSADDLAMHAALAARGTGVLAAVTKSDKVPRGHREPRRRALQETLGLDADQIALTSARTGDGIAELREAIGHLVTRTAEGGGGKGTS
ncbi:MAG: ribosome biogenesis GTP-binding protein YihA/YsxC [Gemmatimonadales bacterium]